MTIVYGLTQQHLSEPTERHRNKGGVGKRDLKFFRRAAFERGLEVKAVPLPACCSKPVELVERLSVRRDTTAVTYVGFFAQSIATRAFTT